jgi:hypothetical protein
VPDFVRDWLANYDNYLKSGVDETDLAAMYGIMKDMLDSEAWRLSGGRPSLLGMLEFALGTKEEDKKEREEDRKDKEED